MNDVQFQVAIMLIVAIGTYVGAVIVPWFYDKKD